MSHENLVRVYELGRARDGWFLTMEYVEGEDLRTYLAGETGDTSLVSDTQEQGPLRSFFGREEQLAAAHVVQRFAGAERPAERAERALSVLCEAVGSERAASRMRSSHNSSTSKT